MARGEFDGQVGYVTQTLYLICEDEARTANESIVTEKEAQRIMDDTTPVWAAAGEECFWDAAEGNWVAKESEARIPDDDYVTTTKPTPGPKLIKLELTYSQLNAMLTAVRGQRQVSQNKADESMRTSTIKMHADLAYNLGAVVKASEAALAEFAKEVKL